MTAFYTPSDDRERLEALNRIYIKGMATPKGELAFSPDHLVYLKPFISKLSSELSTMGASGANLQLVRQVVDELISDIYAEVYSACQMLGGKRAANVASDYGLHFTFNLFDAPQVDSCKVA